MKIYLARHGETDWNAARRLQGWTDIPLNEKGKRQALELATVLASIELEAIYCSGLKRSFETGCALNREPLIQLAELNEQSLGDFEGVALSEEQFVEFQKQRKDPTFRPGGGESTIEHLHRIRRALQQIRNSHAHNASVLVIGHGGTNNLILQELLKIQTDMMFRIANHEIFLIDLPERGRPTLWKYQTIS
jgi:2,3-bisphosphoglycerate-dependent phosphoglycerate mutase